MITRLALLIVLGAGLVAGASCGRRVPSGLAPREGYIPVQGGRVWYRIVGSGTRTPLLVLHGGPGVPSTYLKPLAALADERPVVFYDQLASGHSEHPVDSALWTMQRFIDELAEVRRVLGLKEVHLYGHSWGTILAAEYMFTHPAGVRSVILAGPVLNLPRERHEEDSLKATLPDSIRRILTRHERAGTCDAVEYQAALVPYYQRYYARRQPWSADLDSAAGSVDWSSSNAMFGPCGSTGPWSGYDGTNRLEQITVPTLFMIGRFEASTVATTRDYQRRIQGAELMIFDSSGHLAMQDEPERYVAAIRGFLDRVDAVAVR